MIYFGQDKISEFYYGGTEIKEMYLGSTKVFQNKHPLFLTLETDGHGTLSADVLSGFEGDTVTLAPTYNTYYRFSGYDCTGGTITDNTFTFGNQNATVQAKFKVNAFTATGGFEKKSNITIDAKTTDQTAGITSYALHSTHTGDIPALWYSTSNRWKPVNASSYSLTANPKMRFELTKKYSYNAWATATFLIGSTGSNSQSWTSDTIANYNKTITTTVQNVNLSITGKLRKSGYNTGLVVGGNPIWYVGTAKYIANGTSGTWTATGIAP